MSGLPVSSNQNLASLPPMPDACTLATTPGTAQRTLGRPASGRRLSWCHSQQAGLNGQGEGHSLTMPRMLALSGEIQRSAVFGLRAVLPPCATHPAPLRAPSLFHAPSPTSTSHLLRTRSVLPIYHRASRLTRSAHFSGFRGLKSNSSNSLSVRAFPRFTVLPTAIIVAGAAVNLLGTISMIGERLRV